MQRVIICLFLVWFSGMYVLQAQHLEKVWETTAALKTPESVLYDETRDVIYVANINGNPAEKDGNGFISRLNADGSEKDLMWITELDAPKGMAIANGMLYVADVDRLIEIDIENGRVVSRYHAPGAVFLNDVAACRIGMVFVSDTRSSRIYALREGRMTIWLEGAPFENPNGLFTEDGKLFVGDNSIFEVDPGTKALTELISDAGGVDGLDKNNQGEFIFSHWAGRIFIQRDGKQLKLFDSTEDKINSADIDFANKPDLVLVPTFFDNRVVAYRIVE